MKKIINDNIMWILALILFIRLYTFENFEKWNLNRTIGWGWDYDLARWISTTTKSSILLFIIGYGILKIYGKTPRLGLSVLHLLLLLILLRIPYNKFALIILVGLLIWGVFLGNFVYAVKRKKV